MRKILPGNRVRVIFSAVILSAATGIFLIYSNTASSEPNVPPRTKTPNVPERKRTAPFIGSSLLNNLLPISLGKGPGQPVEIHASNFAESSAVSEMPAVKVDINGRKMAVRDLEQEREKAREQKYKKENEL